MTKTTPDAVEAVPLAECPEGLFWYGETLCLKTEYGNDKGRIDAYVVSSGEFFWGDQPQTIASQRAQLVRSIDTDFAERALSAQLEAAPQPAGGTIYVDQDTGQDLVRGPDGKLIPAEKPLDVPAVKGVE